MENEIHSDKWQSDLGDTPTEVVVRAMLTIDQVLYVSLSYYAMQFQSIDNNCPFTFWATKQFYQYFTATSVQWSIRAAFPVSY